jgi:hypothetical protein
MLLAPSGRLISITSTPDTPPGMPVSINRNTQRNDDPQGNHLLTDHIDARQIPPVFGRSPKQVCKLLSGDT